MCAGKTGAALTNISGYYHDQWPAGETEADLLGLVPGHLIRRQVLFPVRRSGNRLFVAMAKPFDIQALDDLRLFTGCKIEPLATGKKEIRLLIEKHYAPPPEIEKVLQDLRMEMAGQELDSTLEEEAADQAPVIRLVNLILSKAVEEEASDIHIEPFDNLVRVRFRIDGLLSEVMELPCKMIFPVVSRIKVMADLDIAERRLPQDGRISLQLSGQDMDLRISTLPTVFGEKVVVRLLNKGNIEKYNLQRLGLSGYNLALFQDLIRTPHGMLLVTGPTGSGKTTTLYTALNEINSSDKNIVTIEDPVEYTLANINQAQINEKAGITFANYLRFILRQDPDIIMIGEIRDPETAEIAVQASITGHLLLSTIHTNDAPGVVTRLINMGIAPFMIASSLTGVVAQRLVRRICVHCKQPVKPDQGEKAFAGLALGTDLYAGAGCALCNYTGYKGRVAIYEVMKLSPLLQEVVLQNVCTEEIRQAAISAGMITLKEDGLAKAAAGLTTVNEVMRACRE
ncbi:MAG: type II/IV secretion system protein [Peptococcaceae bacterium]|nr:type II/IV secretion system protein [Candidatus Syntrophopropionicum ammoniitolerans]